MSLHPRETVLARTCSECSCELYPVCCMQTPAAVPTKKPNQDLSSAMHKPLPHQPPPQQNSNQAVASRSTLVEGVEQFGPAAAVADPLASSVAVSISNPAQQLPATSYAARSSEVQEPNVSIAHIKHSDSDQQQTPLLQIGSKLQQLNKGQHATLKRLPSANELDVSLTSLPFLWFSSSLVVCVFCYCGCSNHPSYEPE